MTTEEILTAPDIIISYQQQHDYIYVNWQGCHTVESLIKGCEEILTFVKKTGCTRVLNDNTHLSHHALSEEMWLEPMKWIARDWFPRLYGSGCVSFAWVYSPDKVNKLFPLETLRFKIRNPNIFIFDNKELAASWLNLEV